MLKSYHVPPEYLAKWGMKIPDGRFRLNGTQEVDNIKEADVVIFSMPLRDVTKPILDPHTFSKIVDDLGVDPRRVAAYDCSDDEWTAVHTNKRDCMFIRCNLKPIWKRDMPNSMPWFWPVEDFKELVPVPEGGFKYDVSARMWLSKDMRRNACKSIQDAHNKGMLRADVETFRDFYGYIPDKSAEQVRRKNEFKRSMKESRLALCPWSIQYVFPYRFWEAMSAGRMPILICDDCSFPMSSKVDYDKVMLRVKDEDNVRVGEIVAKFLANTSDKEIIERGLYAREMWETWLNPQIQEWLYPVIIEEKLKQHGLYSG